MIKKHLYILLTFLITSTIYGQNTYQKESVSFDKIIDSFKKSLGWNPLSGKTNDSVTNSSLYKTDNFNVSISKNPVVFDTIHKVLKNPYFTDDFDDYDDNYINYPVSYSVLYNHKLISLFRNGKFVCHNLHNLKRDFNFENELNTKKFKYHWIINNKLGGVSGNTIYVWENNKWNKFKSKFPLKKQPKLFEDSEFVVFGDCHGEWGGTVYFFDKSTQETYFTESTCANSVIKKDDKYLVLAHLGHGMGLSEIKSIINPRKLSKAKKREINKIKNGGALGYSDKSEAYQKQLDIYGIQIFSFFKYKKRQLHVVHLNELTFLAEITGTEIQIVNPLFDNEIYTHNPITHSYGNYILMNLDFYGTALNKEVSVIIVDGKRLIKLDWNENHSR